MRKNILLIFFILFHSAIAEASLLCRDVFKIHQIKESAEFPIFEQIDSMIRIVESQQFLEKSNRKRKKEVEHIRDDLEGIKQKLASRIEKQPYLNDFIKKWEEFNSYWMGKAQEFKDLPPEKQKVLKEYMDMPLSLSLKHFISFFEASHHSQWKINRLDSLLTLHQKHRDVDVETALFLFNRQALKFYSRWDFTRCKY